MSVKFVDLFAGIGGFRLAFESLGAECVFSCEKDRQAKKTYNLNFKEWPAGDIIGISPSDIPKHDIMLAGFPCQSFSIAGNRGGLNDPRGALVYELLKLLQACKPEAFLFENVEGIIHNQRGRTMSIIGGRLKQLGYNVFKDVLNTMSHGNLPQNRKRLFIAGFKNHWNFKFPEKIPLETTLYDILLDEKQADKYYYNDHPLYDTFSQQIDENRVYQWRRSYVRENKSGVCPTLTAVMGTGGHNIPIIRDDFGIRKITPRECARFQGFPDNFSFKAVSDCHAYKQIGNAVSVPVVKRIAEKMLYHF